MIYEVYSESYQRTSSHRARLGYSRNLIFAQGVKGVHALRIWKQSFLPLYMGLCRSFLQSRCLVTYDKDPDNSSCSGLASEGRPCCRSFIVTRMAACRDHLYLKKMPPLNFWPRSVQTKNYPGLCDD